MRLGSLLELEGWFLNVPRSRFSCVKAGEGPHMPAQIIPLTPRLLGCQNPAKTRERVDPLISLAEDGFKTFELLFV